MQNVFVTGLSEVWGVEGQWQNLGDFAAGVFLCARWQP